MIYNIVLVSGVQQSQSATHTHLSTLFQTAFHTGHYRVFSSVPCAIQQLSILYIAIPFSPFIPPPFPPWLLGGPAYSLHMTVREAEGC